MAADPVTALLNIGNTVIDKFFSSPEEKAKAKLDLLKLQQNGEFKDAELQMSAILAEAKSSDPWTSRARPSFLYVIYIMILFGIPMGILSCFRPDMTAQIAEGMKAWLSAIPDMLWGVFGTGYVGYTVVRSAWDKKPIK